MNRGSSSPSAAANYLLCTNCRKVLRKVRARPGVRPERGLPPAGSRAARPRGALLGRGSEGSRGTFAAPRPKKGAWVRVEGWHCCCFLSPPGQTVVQRGWGSFSFFFFLVPVVCFSAHLPAFPSRACSSGGEKEGPVRSFSRCWGWRSL